MVIVYESKTGFTKRYADMLAQETGIKSIRAREISGINKDEEIIFLGWIKVGKIQGLNKLRDYNIKIVCATGTGRTAEPDTETVIARNKLENIPFFYLRGGCYPLKEIKGLDKFLLSIFVKMLKSSRDNDLRTEEAIDIIENGFDGVKVENLKHVLKYIEASSDRTAAD